MPSAEPQLPDTLICPTCHGANPPAAHLCQHCLAPLDSFAATDPMASISSQFNTLSKAAAKPTYLVVVLGMWLILVPVIVCDLFVAAQLIWLFFFESGEGSIIAILLATLFALGISAVYVILLVRTTRNYRRYRKTENAADTSDQPTETHPMSSPEQNLSP